jgi:hypothetical protein
VTVAQRAQREREDLLRASIRYTLEQDPDDVFAWGSLHGLIRSSRDRQVLREETAPRQVELDLHLTGDGVQHHATSASHLGVFVQRMSDATKAVAKQLSGAKRYRDGLLVEGVAPGSVRLILRAPDAAPPPPSARALSIADTETADSRALRRVATVLTLASSDEPARDDSDPLAAAVAGLTPQARTSLRAVVTEMLKAGWEIDGTVRQWRQPEDSLRVTTRAAQSLRTTLGMKIAEPRRVPVLGTLDGFRRSTGVAYIKPDDESYAMAVAVADAKLFHVVARMAAIEELPVRATIEEWQTVHRDGNPGKVSRRLVAIDALVDQPVLEL